MKINKIPALDYKVVDGELTIIFTATTMEDIAKIDATMVTVRTDAGDLMETFAGYALQSVTYNADADNYQAVFVQAVRDRTAETIRQLAEQVDALSKKLDELQPDPQQTADMPAKLDPQDTTQSDKKAQ